jgi:hypothetical protein
VKGVAHTAVPIDDMNACTTDTCDPLLGVIHTPVVIDDADACTADTCDAVTGIHHVAIDPNDNDACTVDVCDKTTGVAHTTLGCDDSDVCTVDACDTSLGCQHFVVNPDDGNACTTDTCDPIAGVAHTTMSCDDSNACTVDTCNAATGCKNTAITYFNETFANNNAGWTLGTGWQIGSATVSSGQSGGSPDPGLDHTPTADNGVAGVFLGGNTGTTLQGPFYLTSPAINLTAVSGSVTLELWRWLNSDYPPYMNSTIEVYNGSAWTSVFAVAAGVPVNDTAWTKVQFDVTAYKNAAFRVRWAWAVTQAGVFSESSWNVDDVRLVPGAPGVCP